jgi:ERCC4-related helicase
VIGLSSETNVDEDRATVDTHFAVVVATAQLFDSMIASGRTAFSRYSAIVFDEAHHAVGDHVFSRILRQLAVAEERPLILGLTASPVSTDGRSGDVSNMVSTLCDSLLHAEPYTPLLTPVDQ